MQELSEPLTKEQEALDKIVELSLLYDFYGALLKESKRQIFEDYVLYNLSLSEIARERSITRQGVHDIVKRCSRELAEYEEKLHLMKKFQIMKEKVHDIHSLVMELSPDEQGLAGRIAEISSEILEEF